jgi:potassium/hydrogen antiporter
LLGDFFVSGDVTVGTLGEIYGLAIAPEETAMTLAEYFAARLDHTAKLGDRLPLGPIQLVADQVVKGRVATVGLDLAEDHAGPDQPQSLASRIRRVVNDAIKRVRVS